MSATPDKDLNYYFQGVTDLEEYLLSNELYWNLPGLSRLTIGGLLLSRIRLETSVLKQDQEKKFDDASNKMELMSLKWRVAWENKIQREIGSRINLWQNYLEDYRGAPEEFGDSYIHEVRVRVMLQLLTSAVSGHFKEHTILRTLDDRIKNSFLPGSFIWSDELSKKLDEKNYWFLYGTLRIAKQQLG